jgi:hypothetical protein
MDKNRITRGLPGRTSEPMIARVGNINRPTHPSVRGVPIAVVKILRNADNRTPVELCHGAPLRIKDA